MTLKVIALSVLIVMGAAMKVGAADRTYDVNGFDKIKVASGMIVDVTVGEPFAVSAEAQHGHINHLQVEVQGDTLHISREIGWSFLGSRQSDRYRVTVAMPHLEGVQGTSGATVTVRGATAEFVATPTSPGTSPRRGSLAEATSRVASSGG